MRSTPKISRIELKSRFKKAYKKLEPSVRVMVDDAIRDLMADPIPAGRRLEKLQGYTGVWSARVNRSIRITFHLSGGVASLRNVSTHTDIYHNP